MLDIRRRTGYLFLMVMIGHIVLISAQVNSKSGAPVLEAVSFGVLSEIQRATWSGFGAVRETWNDYAELRHASDENQLLRHRVAELQIELQKQRALALEAERLQALLRFRSQVAAPSLAAQVIARDPSLEFQTLTIDRGTSDGVRRDMAVIAPAGVVGRIVKHGAHAALVQLLIDRDAAAGAIVERSRAGGTVKGRGVDPLMRLEYMSNLADVKVGDTVVTSGLDGIYPKGVVIGRVESVERGGGVFTAVRVRPAVDFSELEEVLVVTVPPVLRSEPEAPE